MVRLLSFLCIVLFPVLVIAQEKPKGGIDSSQVWSKGSITLTTGQTIKGHVFYDDKYGLLHFKDSAGIEREENVSAFEFWDVGKEKQRSFFSLKFFDPMINRQRLAVFELLVDFKDFAMISNIEPEATFLQHIPTLGSVRSIDEASGSMEKTVVVQVETFYFLTTEGSPEQYLAIIRTKGKYTDLDGEKLRYKKKLLDKYVMNKYFTDDEIVEMKRFARRNDVEFKMKDDIVRIFEHCRDVRNQKKN